MTEPAAPSVIFEHSPEFRAYVAAVRAASAAVGSESESARLAEYRLARDRLRARFPIIEVPDGEPPPIPNEAYRSESGT